MIGSALPSVTFTDNAHNPNSSATTHTYSSQSIGTAHAKRTVFVIACSGDASTISSCTIAGNAATQIASGAGGIIKIYGLLVTSGTTATIVTTTSASCNTDCIAVFAAYNLRSLTAVDTTTPAQAVAASRTLTLTTSNKGIAIGFCHKNTTDETNTSATWSGMTEHNDTPMWRNRYSCASAGPTAAESRAVTCTWSNTTNLLTAISASFR